jgi:hypothetical protein
MTISPRCTALGVLHLGLGSHECTHHVQTGPLRVTPIGRLSASILLATWNFTRQGGQNLSHRCGWATSSSILENARRSRNGRIVRGGSATRAARQRPEGRVHCRQQPARPAPPEPSRSRLAVESATARTQREAQDDGMQPRQPQLSRRYPPLANFGSCASALLSGPHG